MYQLVIFDWDGTLMDSTQKIANCIRLSARDVGLPVPTFDEAKRIIGLGLDECMNVLFPQAQSHEKQAMIDRYKYQFVTGDQTEQTLFDGVAEGLAKLNETGVMLAVATGKSRIGLDRVMTITGVAQEFAVTRCADETRSKPHPQMLEEILEFTSIDLNKTVMIGDTSFDLEMAANAGVAGLGVTYGAHDLATLADCNNVGLLDSPTDMINWLLDGRLEKAYD